MSPFGTFGAAFSFSLTDEAVVRFITSPEEAPPVLSRLLHSEEESFWKEEEENEVSYKKTVVK